MKNIPLIAIVGPTASGKTAVGIRIAQAVDGEVLCVDSRTVYKGMDIGTAKVTGAKGDATESGTDIHKMFEPRSVIVEGIPHWGIDLVEPDAAFTAADFIDYAKNKILDISRRGKIPILVGGTGLYFRALLDGLTLTDVDPDPALRTELEAKSTEELAEMLGEHDPDAASAIDIQNRRRLIRALEIVLTTGQPLKEQQKMVATPYEVCWIGVDVEREELYRRIDERLDGMIAEGLVDEARTMFAKYGAEGQAMSGIGYRQLALFFQGKMSLRDAVERIKFDSHHYAKRQLTWFKADARIHWSTNLVDAIATAKKFLHM